MSSRPRYPRTVSWDYSGDRRRRQRQQPSWKSLLWLLGLLLLLLALLLLGMLIYRGGDEDQGGSSGLSQSGIDQAARGVHSGWAAVVPDWMPRGQDRAGRADLWDWLGRIMRSCSWQWWPVGAALIAVAAGLAYRAGGYCERNGIRLRDVIAARRPR